MIRSMLFSTFLTGSFCGAFAVGIDWATDMLDRTSILMVSFASGFLGSMFAQSVLAGWRKSNGGDP
ncbi:MAG: hypothetical protein ABJF50_14945 [Paracoccaceae bacterium]